MGQLACRPEARRPTLLGIYPALLHRQRELPAAGRPLGHEHVPGVRVEPQDVHLQLLAQSLPHDEIYLFSRRIPTYSANLSVGNSALSP